MSIPEIIAQELKVRTEQVQATIDLLDSGDTVPFIARYRKEATGGLSDDQLRELHKRLKYLRDLEERRATILASIKEQGQLSPDLEKALRAAATKTELEDLYLPFKPKRHTKAQQAREAGLEPLADLLLANQQLNPEQEALRYVDASKGVADLAAALEGARHILTERLGDDATLLFNLREWMWRDGAMTSKLVKKKETEGAKFKDYFDFSEPLKRIPSHRALALFRGQGEGVLNLKLTVGDDASGSVLAEQQITRFAGLFRDARPSSAWIKETIEQAWKTKLKTKIETDLKNRLREGAETEAIQVFSRNLKDLLLAAPAGPRATMGLDPGLRTGVKVAVVDSTGKLLDTATIYPHPPRNQWDDALQQLATLAGKHKVELVSIGNGTASRETDKLADDLNKKHPELKLTKIMVSEAGASVYSASEFASKEFPDVDVSLRGAISIARRLQDPLAELVKIEPKSIGVGQYQHDLPQDELAHSLDDAIEDCVNAVGVNLNTASVPLLARVAGLNQTLAQNIVTYRQQSGKFEDRMELTKVTRLGPKAFEQAAGFLRIPSGRNPLDASAVHPEAYPVVERILKESARGLKDVLGNPSFLRGLKLENFTDSRFGLPTVTDIVMELEKPGRDPRPEFKTAKFKEGVETMKDLQEGMELEGTVTNVTNFGAFVDVGVHQDGLVHISQLADTFVKDPHDVVKAGDTVKVKVLKVEADRKRIALTMKRNPEKPVGRPAENKPQAAKPQPVKPQSVSPKSHNQPQRRDPKAQPKPVATSAFGKALSQAIQEGGSSKN